MTKPRRKRPSSDDATQLLLILRDQTEVLRHLASEIFHRKPMGVAPDPDPAGAQKVIAMRKVGA